MEKATMITPIILFFFGMGVVFLIMSYLSFRGKISLRWFYIYHHAPTKETNPDFMLETRLYALLAFLMGITTALFGLYQMYNENWIKLAVITGFFVAMITSAISGLIIAKKSKKHKFNKQQFSIAQTVSDIDEEFSITETHIDALKGIIIIGCYLLLPLIVFAYMLAFIARIPQEYFNFADTIPLLAVSLILGLGSWILDKLIPKMTFSYQNGVFKKERNGKIETFPKTAVHKVVMQSTVLPDYIYFYLKGRKKPIKVSMKGFKWDDRFDIPRKIIHITNMRLTRTDKEILDDFNKHK